jgi:hypothetical protein
MHFGFLKRREGKEAELDHARRLTHPGSAPFIAELATRGPAGIPGIGIGAPVAILLTAVLEIAACTPEAARALECMLEKD